MGNDQTLIHVRERTYLDILDLALVVLRRKPVAIGLAAVAGAAPFVALNSWLMRQGDVPFVVYLMLLAFEIPWATAPLTVVLGGLMFGVRPSARRTFRTLLESFVSMVLFQSIFRGVLLCTLLLILLMPLRLAFLNEVILLERGRWRTVLRRCLTLCQAREGELVGQWLAQFFFGTIFVLAFWAGSHALIRALFSSELAWEPSWNEVVGPSFHLAVWIAIEFFAITRFFSYIDQRIRLEGWEVEQRVSAAGRTLEDAARW